MITGILKSIEVTNFMRNGQGEMIPIGCRATVVGSYWTLEVEDLGGSAFEIFSGVVGGPVGLREVETGGMKVVRIASAQASP